MKLTPAVGIDGDGLMAFAELICESGTTVTAAYRHPSGTAGAVAQQHGQAGSGMVVISLPGPADRVRVIPVVALDAVGPLLA